MLALVQPARGLAVINTILWGGGGGDRFENE
jgi:hypothetical protein